MILRHHVTLTFLIFRLLKNYGDIRIQHHGRHLPVDFCYTVYSTNTIEVRRGAVHIIIVSIILLTLLYVSLRYKLGAMKKKYPKVAEFSQRAPYKNYSLKQPKTGN